jgi:GPH family glycoside/pentoside/hexuronide:cation symporter
VDGAAALAGAAPAILERRRLGAWLKIAYGVGEIPNAVKTILFGLFSLYFYGAVMGLSGTLVGIATAVGLVWDAVIDPYIGHFSDRCSGRFGRRHGLMLLGAITMGASFWAFFSPPRGAGQLVVFAWLVGTGVLVRTTTSLYAVPYFALGAELSEDYQERTSVTAVRGFMAMVGTLGAASLSFLLFFPDLADGRDSKAVYDAYPAMGLACGLLMTALGLVATFGTWRTRRALGAHAASTFGFRASVASSLRSSSFRILLATCSLFFLALVINGSVSIHYLTHYARVTGSASLSTFQFAFYVGGLLGVIAWYRLSKSVEKHWLLTASVLGVAFLMPCAVLLIGADTLVGDGAVRGLTLGHAVGGLLGSAIWFVPGSMIADVADEDELATGSRREGSFFGVFYLGQQLAAGAAAVVAGVLLDWFAGFAPGEPVQRATTAYRIALIYGLFPALLVAISAALLPRYALTRAKVAAIQQRLHARVEQP